MDWSSWIQDVGKQVITTRTEAKYKQPFEIQKMQLQAMGPFGMPYIEGSASAPTGGAPAAVAGIPTSWLLIGGVIAVILLAGD